MLRYILIALSLSFSATVSAYPMLQLDIESTTTDYDTMDETIITFDRTFKVRALGQKAIIDSILNDGDIANDTFFISIAFTPAIPDQNGLLPPFGTLDFGDETLDYTDFAFGTPPLSDADFGDADPGDLPSHGIFPTYFAEVSFLFDTTSVVGGYNTQDDPGLDPLLAPEGTHQDLYLQEFMVDLNGLALDTILEGHGLHFNLFNTEIKEKVKRGELLTDTDRDLFAPFSHDAAFINQPLPPPPPPNTETPEPAGLLLAMTALGIAARRRKLG